MEKNIIKELLKRPVAVNPIFIKITGRLGDGYLLSQVMYWYFSKNKDGQEFFKTDNDWMEELYMSKKEIETSKKSLKTLGFISIEKKGKGNRSYYTFCSDNVYEAILTTKEKAKKISVQKVRLSQNGETSSFPQNGDLGFPERGRELSTKGGNPIYITESTTETTTENIILPNGNIEQGSNFSSLGNFEKIKNETQKEASVVNDAFQRSSAGVAEIKEDKRDPDIQLIIDTIKELNGGITDDARDKIRISARNIKLKINKMVGFNGDYSGFLIALHRGCNDFYKEKFGSVEGVYWNLSKIIANVKANIQKQETPKNKVTFG